MRHSINLGLILLIAFLFAAATLRQLSVSPPDIQTDHRFDTAQAFSRLERILGDETPHPVDSDASSSSCYRCIARTRLRLAPVSFREQGRLASLNDFIMPYRCKCG